MPRSISITRRRAHLVDLSVVHRPNIVSFQFKASANWDGSFTLFATVPLQGIRSPSVADSSYGVGRFDNVSRFLFDPADYTATVAAVKDDTPFYVRIAPVDDTGAVGTDEAIHVIMPYNTIPNRTFVMQGTVPNQASQAAALEIQLPQTCNDFEFKNDGAVDLFVSFERPGAEYKIQPSATVPGSFQQQFTNVSEIFIRGSGATTTMSAIFTYRNNTST